MLENDVSVLDLSFGRSGYSPVFEAVIAVLRQKDVICVAPVGNEGPDTSVSPGNYRDVISVGAIDARDKVAPFSSLQTLHSRIGVCVERALGPSPTRSEHRFSGRQIGVVGNSRDLTGFGTCCGSRCAATPGCTASPRCRYLRFSRSLPSSKKPPRQSPVRVGHGVPDGVEAIRHLARKGLADAGFLTQWSP